MTKVYRVDISVTVIVTKVPSMTLMDRLEVEATAVASTSSQRSGVAFVLCVRESLLPDPEGQCLQAFWGWH